MNKQREALEAALYELQNYLSAWKAGAKADTNGLQLLIPKIEAALAEPEQDPVVLPDGSAFFTMSLPLPKDHWLTQPRQYATPQSEEPIDLPAPFVPRTVSNRELITLAARYAIRAATDCGKESDFDPDAMVQAFVYATLGPYPQRITSDEVPSSPQPREWKELSETELHNLTASVYLDYAVDETLTYIRNVYPVISAALRDKNEVKV